MKQFVQLMEELSLNAHPALNVVHYDGWVVRLSNQYTSRANSVNVIGDSSIPFETKIDRCEQIYSEAGQACIFKITPNSLAIDSILNERGYEILTPTDLMVCDLGDLQENNYQSQVSEGITKEWQERYFPLTGVSMEQRETAYQIQSRIIPTKFCAQTEIDGIPVACGLGVMERGYVGFYDIAVAEEYRRRGFGYDLCNHILNEATKRGVTKAYLQVVASNEKAHKMYEKLGYHKIYTYWYRIKR